MPWIALHAGWMILAVAVGTVAGYMGLVHATSDREGRGPLPGRFVFKAHVGFGAAYYVMLYLGMVYGWIMHEFIFDEVPQMPPRIVTLHMTIAGCVAVLYAAAWALGASMVRKPPAQKRLRPRLHMACNLTACTLVAVQIAVAVYCVWLAG